MAIAFTFPGQGSQAVGMGKDLAENFAEARVVFEEVDEALGQKLSDIMWNGPEETLTLTANAQPALMAVSLAVIRVLDDVGSQLDQRGLEAQAIHHVEVVVLCPDPGDVVVHRVDVIGRAVEHEGVSHGTPPPVSRTR